MDGAYKVVMDSAERRGLVDRNDLGFVPELERSLLDMARAAVEVGMKVSPQEGLSFRYVAQGFIYVYLKSLEAVIQWAESPTGRIDTEFTAMELLKGTPSFRLKPEMAAKVRTALPDAKAMAEDLMNWAAGHMRDFGEGRLDACTEMRQGIYAGAKVAVANALKYRRFFKDINGNCQESMQPPESLLKTLLKYFRR